MSAKIFDKKGKLLEAGGIIIKEENGQKYILLIYRKFHNDWSFPKGHVEENENFKDTAAREIKEETGLKVELVKELPADKYYNDIEHFTVIVYMYLFWPLTFDLKSEYDGDKTEWVKLEDVEAMLTYNDLKEYFRNIQNYL